MAKVKYDGVVEAVHYAADGQVEWVRAYLKRGPAFSDRMMLARQALIEDLKAGKRYLVGRRIPLMGGVFEVSKPLRVLRVDAGEALVTGDLHSEHDRLESVPVI
ncbi:MAG: hypothetical protein JXA78_10790 [Anaerolineales bacterium]|nr:hypothetical protein [Anaerolineales bacterium]